MASAAAAAKSLQSCPTLCDPIDGSPPGSPVPGILQERGSGLHLDTGVGCHFLLQCMKVKSESEVSHVRLLATPWTAAHQAPPSMEFTRQEYWSGVPLPSGTGKPKEINSPLEPTERNTALPTPCSSYLAK